MIKRPLLTFVIGCVATWYLLRGPLPEPNEPSRFTPVPAPRVDHSDLWKSYIMPQHLFTRLKNRPDHKGSGSCVQASLAMCGSHHHCPPAEFLLEDSKYGRAELGGSWPGRVANYCRARGIPIVNIEGPQSIKAIEIGLRDGKYVGITYGVAHMICAVGMSPDRQTFYVVDNNYPDEIRAVDRRTFIEEHRGYAGGWAAFIAGDSPPPWFTIGG